MFKQRPQSPEIRSEDPKVTRETKVALAVGFLTAAIEANQSREVFAIPTNPNIIEQSPVYTTPVLTGAASRELLIEQARTSAERAFNAHGAYTHPAEDMTDDFIDAQKMFNRQQTEATVIPFPQQLADNNPIIRKPAA